MRTSRVSAKEQYLLITKCRQSGLSDQQWCLNHDIRPDTFYTSLPEDQRNCVKCGAELEPIGKEFVRHEFRFTLAKGEVINIYRETYKCPVCSTANTMAENIKFVKAHVPDALIPNSYTSESVVAWVMYQKLQMQCHSIARKWTGNSLVSHSQEPHLPTGLFIAQRIISSLCMISFIASFFSGHT